MLTRFELRINSLFANNTFSPFAIIPSNVKMSNLFYNFSIDYFEDTKMLSRGNDYLICCIIVSAKMCDDDFPSFIHRNDTREYFIELYFYDE